jgi:hypothetical protein
MRRRQAPSSHLATQVELSTKLAQQVALSRLAGEHRGGHATIARLAGGATHGNYKLPIATFANPPAIDSRTGTVHGQSVASGELDLRDLGSAGAGTSLEGTGIDFWEGGTRLLASSAPVEPMLVSLQRQMKSSMSLYAS